MLTFRELVSGLKTLRLEPTWPLLVHASPSFPGEVRGGAETALGALLATADAIMMPVFTFKTMIIPETGPENNGLVYGSGDKTNRLAEFYWPNLPADPQMGALAEQLRRHPHSTRSNHPLLSFTGINTLQALQTQTVSQPLAPIGSLADQGGWVLLIGVDHTANTSIHYACAVANRSQFVRWALTPTGVMECPGFSGCSNGFNQAEPLLEPFSRQVQIGDSMLRALPLIRLVHAIADLIEEQPLALLCDRSDCECCNAIRRIGH